MAVVTSASLCNSAGELSGRKSNTGEGGKDPEMQNLSNHSSLTFYSTADVEEEIVSRGGLKTG